MSTVVQVSVPILTSFNCRVADPSQRENLGIIVQYKVKVKLCLGALGGDLAAELPFILMHPKPEEETPPAAPGSRRSSKDVGADVPVDANLIQLDAYVFFFLFPFIFIILMWYVKNVKDVVAHLVCRLQYLSSSLCTRIYLENIIVYNVLLMLGTKITCKITMMT
jgi:hypothetical protein